MQHAVARCQVDHSLVAREHRFCVDHRADQAGSRSEQAAFAAAVAAQVVHHLLVGEAGCIGVDRSPDIVGIDVQAAAAA